MKQKITFSCSFPTIFFVSLTLLQIISLGSWYGWEWPHNMGALGIIFYGIGIISNFLCGLVGLLIGLYKGKPWRFMFGGYVIFVIVFFIFMLIVTR